TSTKVNTGFNNPELGAAFAIDRVKGLNKLFCAFNTMVKLPIRGGGDPIIGFAQTDVEFGLRSLGNLRIGLPGGYWVSDIAYRTRFGAPADELRYNANASVRVALHWYVVALAQTTTGMRNGRPTQIGANYILNPDYSSYSAQLTTIYKATRTRMVQFGFNRELAGRNAGAGTTAIMTIWQYF
ncbi:MAG TPA: hypothetical protein VNJ04_15385, partial [Gemmatimonadaceae bacterium]|nr:hypothetical protein [Gemmatimonadaceae bacterium]